MQSFWFANPVENVREVLQLSAEQKGVLVPVGELTVHLNKLTPVPEQEEAATLTNDNAANGTSEYMTLRIGRHILNCNICTIELNCINVQLKF